MGIGKRHIFAIMAFIGICLSYAIRFNLSIVIVVMVNSTRISEVDIGVDESFDLETESVTQKTTMRIREDREVCPEPKASNSSNNPLSGRVGELNWDESTVGLVLGSFFWGYVLTQVPGGFLAQRFGGKFLFGFAQLASALVGLLIPLSSYAGPYFLTVIRLIQGLLGGITIPASHVMISKWVPPKERGKFANFIYAGMPFGAAITLLLSGYIAHYLGWGTVFYITGLITTVWTVAWFWIIYESPFFHQTISDEEYRYIEASLADERSDHVGKLETPWKDIFTSVPFWAIIICHPCTSWGHYTMLILIPTYLKTALHFDLTSNSLISTAPHLFSWLMSLIIVQFGDILQNQGLATTGTVRKINMTITLWGSAACLIGVAFAGCNYKLAVILLILAVGSLGGVYGGVLCNHIDIAPNFAGILLGMSNTLASIPGFLSPGIAGYILQGNPSVGQWRKVFYLTAGIHIFGNIVFMLFASGRVQAWNNGKQQKKFSFSSTNKIIDVMT